LLLLLRSVDREKPHFDENADGSTAVARLIDAVSECRLFLSVICFLCCRCLLSSVPCLQLPTSPSDFVSIYVSVALRRASKAFPALDYADIIFTVRAVANGL